MAPMSRETDQEMGGGWRKGEEAGPVDGSGRDGMAANEAGKVTVVG